MIDGKKLAGILVESLPDMAVAIVGVGLNVQITKLQCRPSDYSVSDRLCHLFSSDWLYRFETLGHLFLDPDTRFRTNDVFNRFL